MGFLPNFMESTIWPLFLLLIFIPTSTQEEGFISVLVSSKGLDFAKDLIIEKGISSMIPLQLPKVEKKASVPILGEVDVVLSNVTIYSVDVNSSYVKSGETGIVLIVSGATAKLSMNWKYSYKSWFVEISDHGTASIQVDGMDVGVTTALADQGGTLKLSVLQSGCHVTDISVTMDGGASWFYQGLVDVFEDIIRSVVEDTISSKIKDGVRKLNSLLQSLPKEILVHDIVAMNVTFVDDPLVSKSFIQIDINGLFVDATDNLTSSFYRNELVDLVAYNASDKMVQILLHEKVFNSASSVFFNEGYMQWNIKEVEDLSFFNTSKWKYIVPQLYKKYPNDAIELEISVTSPPIVRIWSEDTEATIYLDVTISVLDSAEVVPVACISLEITASFSPKISGNYLVGTLKLEEFAAGLKWSRIGSLHMHLIKSVMSVVLKRAVLPYVNLNLQKGLPLPVLRGFTLQNAEISCTNTELVISSDISFVEQWHSVSRDFV